MATSGQAVKFHVGTYAEYLAAKNANPTLLSANDFYFTSDTHELFLGADRYCEAYKLVEAFPSQNPQANIIYINEETYEAKIWDGSAWQVVSPAIVSTIDTSSEADDDAVPTVGAVKALVSGAAGDVSVTVSDTATIDMTKDANNDISASVKITATQGNVTLSAEADGLKAQVAEASTSAKGIIEIATDAEATAGSSEVLAVNPKQLQAEIASGIADKIELTDLSIASGSANYLTYDNTTGEIGANVDTAVTDSSTNLVTSGAVATAIGNALVGGVLYKGTFTATGETDYSSITLPVKAGYLYAVSGSATIGGVELNTGDFILINKDVASGGTITSADVDKIDNTEASDIVRLDATQTLANKTIDADDNTITDLTTTNFKSGTIVTSIASTSTDSEIPTAKAVYDAIDNATLVWSTIPAPQAE